VRHFYAGSAGSLDAALQSKPGEFTNANTAAAETCLIAFTSGTSGDPKGTMHFHRDVMAICDCWPQSTLRPTARDIFIGSPPLAFTFGLGGLLLFPIRAGACTVLLERARPDLLLEAIAEFGATICFTTPTGYRAMAPLVQRAQSKTLRKCVSAGEVLPASTRTLWREATGIELIDGIGATELLHIFISADEHSARPGATGKPIPGYAACVMGEDGRPVPAGEVGALAIKGPTGCRYLGGDRQATYVKNGWNYTGDAYSVDADGYFICHGRTDDIIVSSGYKIAAPEVEAALLEHRAVKACVVVGVPDEARGQLVKAFILLDEGVEGTSSLVEELQSFVKARIAPYKYPRAIEFRGSLPTSEAGKLQRFKLRG
jgi:2-aminobenzoate-CoA ligase